MKGTIHSRGIDLHQLFKNWLGKTQEDCASHSHIVVQLVEDLGWIDNHQKSDLIHKHEFNFIGTHYNLVNYKASLIEDNLDKLQQLVLTFQIGQFHTANHGIKS